MKFFNEGKFPDHKPDASKDPVFVFGSNLSGRHGAGAAKYAAKWYGATEGASIGHWGNSYAIPTKDYKINTLPLKTIAVYVNDFLEYARNRKDLVFKVTRIGCGLAGYSNEDIAPMFKDAPDNCIFEQSWKSYLTTE